MALPRVFRKKPRNRMSGTFATRPLQDSSGIALFMVISAVGVLAILVSEFTYISQISQMIAFGSADQAKAHYLAKSGLKLSLLRLKAYQKAKELLQSGGGAATAMIPKGTLEKIWNFPFFYPIPTSLPGISTTDKDLIDKFQKESNLEGSFSAVIESESSKYNLNLLLAGYAPSPNPSSAPPSTPTGPQSSSNPPTPTTPNPTASTTPFNSQAARESLYNFLNTILTQKNETDADFATAYRDFRLDEFVDAVTAWADRSYERRTSTNRDRVQVKRAPFYSLTELHMIPNFDDELYELFANSLTVSPTPGLNVNTMQEATLRALIPNMSKVEVEEFFKYRDAEETDHLFTDENKFYDYLTTRVSAFRGGQALTEFKSQLAARHIRLVTDETHFKITVRAQVNNSVRTLEAWVTLEAEGKPSGAQIGGQTGSVGGSTPNSGLKVTYMRIT